MSDLAAVADGELAGGRHVQRTGPARPRLLTAAEAADFLRLRESTLRDYARRGVVPSVRIGRHVRFLEPDLVAWLEGLRPEPLRR